jgi:hypothetical protein
MSNASARSKSEPLAGSAPRASSCRTKSSNRSEANASRNVKRLPKNASRYDRLGAIAASLAPRPVLDEPAYLLAIGETKESPALMSVAGVTGQTRRP